MGHGGRFFELRIGPLSFADDARLGLYDLLAGLLALRLELRLQHGDLVVAAANLAEGDRQRASLRFPMRLEQMFGLALAVAQLRLQQSDLIDLARELRFDRADTAIARLDLHP